MTPPVGYLIHITQTAWPEFLLFFQTGSLPLLVKDITIYPSYKKRISGFFFFFFYSCCFLFPHISHPIHYKSYRLNLEKYILIFLEYLFYLLKPSWAKPLATVKSCLSYFGSEVISERLSSLKSKFGSQLLSS